MPEVLLFVLPPRDVVEARCWIVAAVHGKPGFPGEVVQNLGQIVRRERNIEETMIAAITRAKKYLEILFDCGFLNFILNLTVLLLV